MPTAKTAFIVGGSGDIGHAISLELARQGLNIAVGHYLSATKVKAQLKKIKQTGVRAETVYIDVTSKESIEAAYSQVVAILGIPSVVIHCAGDSRYGLIQDMADADYDYLMDVHVRGAFYLVKAALPNLLCEKWGRIIFIASIWGETGGAMESLYSAAKAAQIGLTKSLAKELAPAGVTVNAVAPGAIATQLLSRQLSQVDQDALDIPMGRVGAPNEVAAAVGYLCREEANYTTGQVIGVNGGWYV